MEDLSRYWSTEYHHNYSWQFVASLYWKRYPNPHSKHVYSEDTIDVKVDKSTGILKTKRIIMKSNKLPWWGEHLFSARRVAVIEEATIDPSRKCMTTYTRNIGLRFFMGTTEKVTYTSCHDTNICDKDNSENAFPENTDGDIHQTANDRTKVLKEVWIESDVLGLRSAIKKFGLDRYKRNYLAASEGFEFVLQSHEGSTGAGKGLVTNSKANDSTVTSSTGVSHGLNVDSTIKLKQYTRAYS